jgi:glucose-6-phosphate isomerase
VLKSRIAIDYENATDRVIGSEHGIAKKDLDKRLEDMPQKIRDLRKDPQICKKEDAYKKLLQDDKILEEVKELVARLKKGPWENLIVLGIGGSALGNIALQTALNPYMYNLDDTQRRGLRLFVFDNIDPPQLYSFLKWLDSSDRLSKTIFNVISRSGTAAETMSQLMIIRSKLNSDALRNQVIVTTVFDRNPLHRIAETEGLLSLEIPEHLGGRFSVLSAVGLFSAAMCGIQIDTLLEGARDMDDIVSCQDFDQNPAAILAAINHYFYETGKKISVMMPYSYALKDLADWYRQLWAESLGKARDLDGRIVHVGPTPVKALGTTDQHSQLQLYLDGPNDKLFTFLQVNNFAEDLKVDSFPSYVPELGYLDGVFLRELFSVEKKVTESALVGEKRPCLTIAFEEVNEYTVGQFIYLYEVTTSLTGALFGINPYDQPSVKLVRDAISRLMVSLKVKR